MVCGSVETRLVSVASAKLEQPTRQQVSTKANFRGWRKLDSSNDLCFLITAPIGFCRPCAKRTLRVWLYARACPRKTSDSKFELQASSRLGTQRTTGRPLFDLSTRNGTSGRPDQRVQFKRRNRKNRLVESLWIWSTFWLLTIVGALVSPFHTPAVRLSVNSSPNESAETGHSNWKLEGVRA